MKSLKEFEMFSWKRNNKSRGANLGSKKLKSWPVQNSPCFYIIDFYGYICKFSLSKPAVINFDSISLIFVPWITITIAIFYKLRNIHENGYRDYNEAQGVIIVNSAHWTQWVKITAKKRHPHFVLLHKVLWQTLV